MKIIEHMKNIFIPAGKLPQDFVHNADFDVAFLIDVFGRIPEVVHARNGRNYVYFEKIDNDSISVVRKMGFSPRLHKSRKYCPAKHIYRAPLSSGMPKTAWMIADRLRRMKYSNEVCDYKQNPVYMLYIESYKYKAK